MHRRHVNGREPPARRPSRRRAEHGGPLRRGLRRFVSFVAASVLLAALAIGLGHQRLRQGPVSLGPGVAGLVADRLGAGAPGLDFAIGDVVFALGDPGRPAGLRLRDVAVRGKDGVAVASAPELVVDFRPMDALMGRLEPTALELHGASVALVRGRDGRLRLDPAPPAETAEEEPDASPGLAGFLALLDADGGEADGAAGQGPLRRLTRLSARDALVALHDEATGREWRLADAQLAVELQADREVGRVSGRVVSTGPDDRAAARSPLGPGGAAAQGPDVFEAPRPGRPPGFDIEASGLGYLEAMGFGDGEPGNASAGASGARAPALAADVAEAVARAAREATLGEPWVTLRGSRMRGEGTVEASLVFLDLPLSDLAAAPALGAFEGLDSRASGELDLALGGGGELRRMTAKLDLGAGALPGLPAPFDRIASAQADLAWDAGEKAATLRRLAVAGPAGAASLSGRVTPWGREPDGTPTAWRAELAIDRLQATEATGFVQPIAFARGRLVADLFPAARRLELDALDLETDLSAPRQAALFAAAFPAAPIPAPVPVPALASAPAEPAAGGADEPPMPFSAHARGVATMAEEGPNLSLTFSAEPFDGQTLMRAWPRPAAPGARVWMEANMQAARIDAFSGAFWMGPDLAPEVTLDFAFSDLTSMILEGMPPVEGAAGTGRATLTRFDMEFSAATATPPGGEPLNLAGSRFSIPDVIEDPQPAAPEIRAEGRIADLMALIDLPPLMLTRKLGVDLGEVRGRATVQADLSFRLLKDLDVDDVGVKVAAQLHDLALTAPAGGPDVAAEALSLEADVTSFRLWGGARIDGLPAQVAWQERFDAALPAAQRRRIEAKTSLGQAELDAMGLGTALTMPEGRASVSLAITGADQGGAFQATADLGPAALRAPEIGWSKPKGAPGVLTARGTRGADGSLKVDRLSVDAPDLKVQGRVSFGPGRSLRRLTLDRIALGQALDAGVTATAGADGGLDIAVTGAKLDIAALTARRDQMAAEDAAARGATAAGQAASESAALANLPDLTGKLQFDTVTLVEGVDLRGATGEVTRRSGVTAVKVEGAVNGGGEARLRYREGRQGGVTVSLRSDDAGRLLDDLGISDAVSGGTLSVRGRLPPGDSTLEGVAELSNLRVAGRKALEGVVTIARRDGIIERPAEGEVTGGYVFDKVEAPFRMRGQVVTVTDALAAGPMLALKVNGDYDVAADRLDLQGVLTPAYAVNGILNGIPIIGDLLGGEGEGIFAMNFTVTGDSADPQVAADPLSMLTPGLLRRLLQPSRDSRDRRSQFPDLFDADK